MIGGYAGKILEVDLTTSKVNKIPLDMDIVRNYIGGRGYMDRLLWDRVGPSVQPFASDNQIMFFTGPTTGLLSSPNTVLRFKSPLTSSKRGRSGIGHTVIGAQWGPELRFAGYDGLIVTGRAENPVYLYVHDDDIEVRKAKHVWGMTSFQTEAKIKEETDPLARVLCIGPAGENLVRYASVQSEYFRSAARCGGGAVMGSKNLKGIAVRGTKGIRLADKETCFRMMKDALEAPKRNPQDAYQRLRWGTSLGTIGASDRSVGPYKNFKEASYPGDDVEKSGGLQWEMRSRIKNRGCFGCPTPCMQVGVTRTGPYAGTVDSPDFDSTDLIGPNCAITDQDGMYAVSSLCDGLGLDAISTGVTLSWTMESYEKGVLTKKDLGGVDLTWGNVPAMLEMTKRIARREGIGDILAEGVKRASEKVGKGTERFAIHSKGVEFGIGGVGNSRDEGQGMNFGMSPYGGVHHYGANIPAQNIQAMCDSLTVCTFHGRGLGWEPLSRLLNAATGVELVKSFDHWNEIASRQIILERAWTIREGFVPLEDDVLPDRMHDEPFQTGPKAGKPTAVYARVLYEKHKQQWYKDRGCDTNGIPTKETLQKLNLDFCIGDLQKLGVL
jgi:aldehyde:ferredoxin oxidoreductase